MPSLCPSLEGTKKDRVRTTYPMLFSREQGRFHIFENGAEPIDLHIKQVRSNHPENSFVECSSVWGDNGRKKYSHTICAHSLQQDDFL